MRGWRATVSLGNPAAAATAMEGPSRRRGAVSRMAPASKSTPRAAYVAACTDTRREDFIAAAVGVFLDDDRIRAIGQRRASEDARALTLAQGALQCVARAGFANHAQPTGRVNAAHGVAIHRGGGKGGLRARGDNRRGQGAP